MPRAPAVAGILDAAERQVRRRPRRLVDEDHAGVDLTRDPLAALDVLSDDRSAQSVRRIIGELDRLVVILHAEDERHRSKELLMEDWILRLDVRQNRRLEEVSRPIDTLATQQNGGATLHRALDLALHKRERPFGAQRCAKMAHSIALSIS